MQSELMPFLNPQIKELIAGKYRCRDSVRKLSEESGIPYNTLRNAVGGSDPIALWRIVQIGDALGVPTSDIVATNDGTPDKPPEPRKVPKPEPQRKEKAGKAPKRATDRWAS